MARRLRFRRRMPIAERRPLVRGALRRERRDLIDQADAAGTTEEKIKEINERVEAINYTLKEEEAFEYAIQRMSDTFPDEDIDNERFGQRLLEWIKELVNFILEVLPKFIDIFEGLSPA